MNFGNEEFQFALELLIAGRNENGATLSDIRGMFFSVLFSLCFRLKWLRNFVRVIDIERCSFNSRI